MSTNNLNVPAIRVARLALSIALSIAGLAISGYMLLRTLMLQRDWQSAGPDVCSAVFGSGCDGVLTDAATTWLGLPVAGWGFIYFGLIAIILGMSIVHRESFIKTGNLMALVVTAIGLGVSVYLASQIARGLVPYCPLCIVVHAINFTLFAAILWHDGRSPRELANDIGGGIAYALGAPDANPYESKWRVTGIITCILAGLVLYQWTLIQSERAVRAQHVKQEGASAVSPLRAYLDSPVRKIPIRDDDPRLGNVGAPVQLIIFSDFQCPACARMAAWSKALQSEFGDAITIVFKHYPLSSNCNPAVTSDFHPEACSRAMFAEAARQNGVFWNFHDHIFGQDGEYKLDTSEHIAGVLGIAPESFREAVESESVRARVGEDAALGQTLGLVGTPTIFINGRILESPDLDFIQQVIRHELTHARLGGV